MRQHGRRGVPLGASTSQPNGNFAVSSIDHAMKERLRIKCYLRYCDDSAWMAKTKAEARRQLHEFNRMAEELGVCVKANAIISPIGDCFKNEHKTNRKRKRSHKRKTY